MNSNRKTVGLMTMSNVINFGSTLQTYATIKTVEKVGYSCVLIDYDYPAFWYTKNAIGNEYKRPQSLFITIIRPLLRFTGLLNCARWLWVLLHRKKTNHLKGIFRNFLHDIQITPEIYDRISILKKPPVFDIYMTGSDQTWNPRYLHTDYSFLLNFVPDKVPKTAYAASFGAKKMLPEYRDAYVKYLSRYDRISTRETSGVRLVKELTGKDAIYTPDPTLMLGREDWCKKFKQKLNLPKKFIFAYILDYVFNPFPKIGELLKHLSRITDMPIVVAGIPVKITESTIVLTDEIGPDGFLECLDKADFVVTTSFHGTAFAVNFEKDFFTVLNHNASIDDRVKSFLESVDLGCRGLVLPQTDIAKITVNDMHTGHSSSAKRLQEMREYTLKYLMEILDWAAQKCDEVQDE